MYDITITVSYCILSTTEPREHIILNISVIMRHSAHGHPLLLRRRFDVAVLLIFASELTLRAVLFRYVLSRHMADAKLLPR